MIQHGNGRNFTERTSRRTGKSLLGKVLYGKAIKSNLKPFLGDHRLQFLGAEQGGDIDNSRHHQG